MFRQNLFYNNPYRNMYYPNIYYTQYFNPAFDPFYINNNLYQDISNYEIKNVENLEQIKESENNSNNNNDKIKETNTEQNDFADRSILSSIFNDNEISIFGFKLQIDDLILIGLIILLLLQKDCDYVLVIILGLILFNISFSNLNLF